MQFTQADVDFVARCHGVDRHTIENHLRDDDARGLEWVQLVAAAVPLVAGLFGKKKKRAPAGPSPAEQAAAQQQAMQQQQQQAAMAAAIAERDNALRATQQQMTMLATQLRAQAAKPPQRLQAQSAPPPKATNIAVPLAIAGVAAIGLVLFLRR